MDDTGEVVAGFGDPRVRFHNLPQNIGEQSGPNNEGLKRARGRYMAMLNHDDLWLPDHLELAVEALEATGADLVFPLLIEGVVLKPILNVTRDNGILTEVWRADWGLDGLALGQVFQNLLAAGSCSAWHVHRSTTDRIFVNYGLIKLVLYDARQGSPTFGRINDFRLGLVRPAMVVIPPGVWHLAQNL